MRALGMSEPAAGVRPGGRRSAGQSAPGLLAVSPGKGTGEPGGMPAPSAAGGLMPGQKCRQWVVVSRRRRLPAAGGSRRSPLSAPSAPAGTLPLRLWQELLLPSLVCAAAGDALSCFQFLISLIDSGFFLRFFPFLFTLVFFFLEVVNVVHRVV